MKKAPRKTPRIPLDVLGRLGSHPQTTKKGMKGYVRPKFKKVVKKTVAEETGGST